MIDKFFIARNAIEDCIFVILNTINVLNALRAI
jgi:hypothetical protein